MTDSSPSDRWNFVVLGGGSAGLLAALTMRAAFPTASVRLVRSPTRPAIGVGESTTRAVPIFLHGTLGIPRRDFYREVQPVWKLGNRLEWGPSEVSHFNYPFDAFLTVTSKDLKKAALYYGLHDLAHAGAYWSLMDQGRSPIFRHGDRLNVNEQFGYHIDNRKFLAYLEDLARQRTVEFVEGDFAAAQRQENGDVSRIVLTDGRSLKADFFLDCSGFQSLLLDNTLGEAYQSYSDTLLCDRALIGSWRRRPGEVLEPYTVTETMDYGWCWKIGFQDHVTRGYVYSSHFRGEDEARRELLSRNPLLEGDNLRKIEFPSGRYERFWVGNVAAIGNASGFLEPMEATALQLITEQLRFFSKALLDAGGQQPPTQMIAEENRRNAARWDDARDFLAVHYRFNTRRDTPFWQHCRAETKLGGARGFVEYYQEVGPSMLSVGLAPEPSIFGFDGYMTMLLGQRVPTKRPPQFTPAELEAWRVYRENIRSHCSNAISMEQAVNVINHPNFRWPDER